MKIQYYQLDAFTEVPFGGNPAGVVPLIPKQGESQLFPNLTEEDMKKIAREINCSETAFIFPAEDPKAAFKYLLHPYRRSRPVRTRNNSRLLAPGNRRLHKTDTIENSNTKQKQESCQ